MRRGQWAGRRHERRAAREYAPPPLLSRPPPSCPGLISYFLPCVQYGFNAERVQGGDCVSHGLKYYLYSCICSCGVSGV